MKNRVLAAGLPHNFDSQSLSAGKIKTVDVKIKI